jgi:hypothetical protein
MVDVGWLISRIGAERLVLRMHVDISSPRARTVVEAFTCSYDDMQPEGFHAVYRHDEFNATGGLSMTWDWLPVWTGEWPEDLKHKTAEWPPLWEEPEDVICTRGPTCSTASKLIAGHPLVLTHLARMQTAAPLMRPDGWSASADDLARRLEGLLRAHLKEWGKLIG